MDNEKEHPNLEAKKSIKLVQAVEKKIYMSDLKCPF